MSNVVPINLPGILGRMAEIGPFQAILYDATTGRIRWVNEAGKGAFSSLQGLTGQLQDVLHQDEAEAWMLEGKLILKSGQIMEYVEHIALDADRAFVSSRTGVWPELTLTNKQLAYVQVSPASTRQDLVMRIIIPMDKPLQLAEDYLKGSGVGIATLTGR